MTNVFLFYNSFENFLHFQKLTLANLSFSLSLSLVLTKLQRQRWWRKLNYIFDIVNLHSGAFTLRRANFIIRRCLFLPRRRFNESRGKKGAREIYTRRCNNMGVAILLKITRGYLIQFDDI